jgi:hypothetical protein
MGFFQHQRISRFPFHSFMFEKLTFQRMPSKDSQQIKAQAQAAVDTAKIHFEVSSPKVFRFIVDLEPVAVSLDVAVGDYDKKLVVPVPGFVQKVGSVAVSFVQPYASWGFNKLFVKKTLTEKK